MTLFDFMDKHILEISNTIVIILALIFTAWINR